MKIPQQNTNSTFQCTSQMISHQNTNFEADTNQIREKLRKKKQILKQSQRKGQNEYLNSKDKRKEVIGCKKYKNLDRTKNLPKPLQKMDKMEKDEYENTMEDQEFIESFFSTELPQYFETNSIPQKQNTRALRKSVSEADNKRLVETYMNEFHDQNQIKVLSLLQQSEKLLFKSQKVQSLPQYEQSALDFILSIKKKQQKQNYDYYNGGNMLQKRLSLILSKQNNLANNGLFYLSGKENQDLEKNAQQISFVQKCYLSEAKMFEKKWENELEKKINEPAESKELAKMLLVLTKCYKSNHKRVSEIMQNYQEQEEKSISSSSNPYSMTSQLSSQSIHQQFYIKTLIKKCLIKTFSSEQTIFPSESHLWNHFKLTTYLEQNIINEGYRDNEKYLPISSEEEYKEYMKRIKNKKIIYKPSLHTSCKACFSSHFERYNPIVKCPECKSRMHKFCGRIDDRCDKCSYKKLGASLKAETPKCFICLNDSTSLMLHKLKGNRYVHNFCMLVHNLWTVVGERLTFVGENEKGRKKDTDSEVYTDSTKSWEVVKSNESVTSLPRNIRKPSRLTSIVIQEQSIQRESEEEQNREMVDQNPKLSMKKRSSNSEQKCKFCLKSSKKEHLRSCRNCSSSCHILCAYLHGCQIQIGKWENNFSINLNITCCPSAREDLIAFDEAKQQRQKSRKYKLNYERYALNYGFENEIKTSKNLESQFNLIEAEDEEDNLNNNTEKEMFIKSGEQCYSRVQEEMREEGLQDV